MASRSVKIAPSEARALAQSYDFEQNNLSGHRGVHVVIDVTSVTATPSVTPRIQGYDGASGKWYDLLVGSAITATGTTVLKIGPGIGSVENGAANDLLPHKWRVRLTHADTDSATYSVGANYVS